MEETYTNMSHYDYAKKVLDNENYNTYSQFVTDVFDNKKGILCLFIGSGGNGKTTLCNKIDGYYPSMFSSSSLNPRCFIINEYNTTHEVIDCLKKYNNVLLTLNNIESIEDISELMETIDIRYVYFMESFN